MRQFIRGLDLAMTRALNRNPVHDVWAVLMSNRPESLKGEHMAIRIKSRGNESAEQLMRRFKKLCEKEGLTKDIRKKEYYEKPSERRNRMKRKAAPRRP
jgi:small subunit ribosomal protein S21